MSPDTGSTSEFPDSVERLGLPDVPDVAPTEIPGYVRTLPRPASRPTMRSRLIHARTGRGAAPGHPAQTYSRGRAAPFDAWQIA
jgi:hypothetical protein